ncbi:MAG: O-antigen ligase [Leptolyngbyaceae bacterium]|nr:O-antigen ligase [Leptolyngbyaceae bacterium]
MVLTGGANQGDQAQYNALADQLIALCIYAISFVLLSLRWKKVLRLVSQDRWILPLIGIALVSVLWSDSPDLTLRRGIALVGTSLFGMYFATRYTIQQQLRLLGWMLGVAIALSFIFVILLPNYGIAGGIHAGAWRGIWSHKNGLAQKMALAGNVFLLLGLSVQNKRWLMWVMLGGAVLLEVRAVSSTGLLTMLVPMMIVPIIQTVRWRSRFMVPASVALIAISGLLALSLFYGSEAVLAFLGEDATLTGRTDFWPLIIEKIQERPLLGYGYEAFWRGFDGPSADIAYATMGGYIPPHAHNGLLQLWLHLGFVGVLVFIIGLWITILRAIALIRKSRSLDMLWPFIYCSILIIFNFSEIGILEYNELDWVLYVAVALSVLQWSKQSEEQESRMIASTPSTL